MGGGSVVDVSVAFEGAVDVVLVVAVGVLLVIDPVVLDVVAVDKSGGGGSGALGGSLVRVPSSGRSWRVEGRSGQDMELLPSSCLLTAPPGGLKQFVN